MQSMIINERTNLKPIPIAAEGKFSIELTDPITGKVKEKVDGKNHVFTESILGASYLSSSQNWLSDMSTIWMCLNSDANDIDATLPYMLGQTVGYGRPSQGSNGTRRGAYNSANQVLADINVDRARWKFQYDFTTAQCNGEQIGCIGLTHQYKYVKSSGGVDGLIPLSGIRSLGAGTSLTHYTETADGRYSYSCSSAGIITKYDILLHTTTTIDVSSVVGTTAGTSKTVGFNPSNGKYYIYAYNATASLRKMYVFTNSTFSSLENTYSPTNLAVTSIAPMYIYGTTAYWVQSSSVYYADFSANVAYSTLSLSAYNNASYNEATGMGSMDGQSGCCPLTSKYIGIGFGGYGVKVIILDISNASISGYATALGRSTNAGASFLNPKTSEKIVIGQYANFYADAIAAKKLDTPITKTSANGMTATYELSVYW